MRRPNLEVIRGREKWPNSDSKVVLVHEDERDELCDYVEHLEAELAITDKAYKAESMLAKEVQVEVERLREALRACEEQSYGDEGVIPEIVARALEGDDGD